MSDELEWIPNGTITSPQGFAAGVASIGLRTASVGAPDLGILSSEIRCVAAGVFTTNRIQAAPIRVCRQHLEDGHAQALVVNSGCANACTGEQGMADAVEMASVTADMLGLPVEDVLVASTGVIGILLPMDRVPSVIREVSLSPHGGHDLARAIMTTDTVPKEAAVRVGTENNITLGGIAKGSGMIHPNLATMLCFLTTDASVEPGYLKEALRRAVDASFNMVTVDGDTSPNDSVMILASGLAGNEPLDGAQPEVESFERALTALCTQLAKSIAGDGEGATRLIEVFVEGAVSVDDARIAARTIAGSPLVKTAVHGSDPNWGRIAVALGRSGAVFSESALEVFVGGLCLVSSGCAVPFDRNHVSRLLSGPDVSIRVCLNSGPGTATAWGCDLTADYVRINSEYFT